MNSYTIKVSKGGEQNGSESLYVGGLPRLPKHVEIPVCRICGQQLTFFFYVSFPDWHTWSGRALSMFACTVNDHPGHEIPRIFTPKDAGALNEATLPPWYLEQYQSNFRIITFDSDDAELRTDYESKVAFRNCDLKPSKRRIASECRIADEPVWIGAEESPSAYGSEGMCFLFQLKTGCVFDIVDTAPLQARRSIHPSLPSFRRERNYTLFVQNALYYFGNTISRDSVYIISQRP